jgi:hypothetical protein
MKAVIRFKFRFAAAKLRPCRLRAQNPTRLHVPLQRTPSAYDGSVRRSLHGWACSKRWGLLHAG